MNGPLLFALLVAVFGVVAAIQLTRSAAGPVGDLPADDGGAAADADGAAAGSFEFPAGGASDLFGARVIGASSSPDSSSPDSSSPASSSPASSSPASSFELPATAERYRDAIRQAETLQGLPHNLLARVLYQESRFRPEIVSGAVRSKAGAVGIAQFLPATAQERGVDPLDPYQAIPGAAGYLRSLYERFGSWSLAVAAYNWGQGNLAAFLKSGRGAFGQVRPAENINYVAEIMRDVPGEV
jgi:soluble lytic murein transglycosylase-like protein